MDPVVINTALAIVAALGVLGEALSLIPGIKANGVFQLIFNIIKALGGKKDGPT